MRIPALACLLLPTSLLAQTDARGAIAGTVYDSVARRPVAGALVQAANAAAPGSPLRTATTDELGRYLIDSVPPGRWLVGFQSDALDSLALQAPEREASVVAGHRTRLDLAVPPAARIVADACRAGVQDSVGLHIGMLRDAGSGYSFSSGTVLARWTDVIIDATGIRSEPRAATSAVSGGWFGLCLPYGTAAVVRGVSGADSSGFQIVDVPPHGVVRRDIFLGGITTVHGRVRTDRDRPLVAARVGFAGTAAITSTDSSGAYRLTGFAGTQTIEVRALGYAADRRTLMLRAGGDTAIDVRLVPLKQVLDTVRVVAERVYSLDHGFEARRRTGIGRFWTKVDIERRRATSIYDLLRQSPSVNVEESGFERRLTMRGGREGRCAPEVFLNGQRLPADAAGDLDILVLPAELTGLELYTVAQVPPQYGGTGDGCGVVVIWTLASARR